MKKGIILAILAILTIPLFASAQVFERDLYYGLRKNEDVKRLQEFLTEQGVYNGVISGNYFTLTSNAVKRLQRIYKVRPVNGRFDGLTRGMVNDIVAEGMVEEDTSGTTLAESFERPAVATPETFTKENTSPKKDAQQYINDLMAQIEAMTRQIQDLQTREKTLRSSFDANTPVVQQQRVEYYPSVRSVEQVQATQVPSMTYSIPVSVTPVIESPQPASTSTSIPSSFSPAVSTPVVTTTPSSGSGGGGGSNGGTTNQATRVAIEKLSVRLSITTDGIEIRYVTPITWGDAALGLYEPGYMYASVLTPGYKITLFAKGRIYTYHTDEKGSIVKAAD